MAVDLPPVRARIRDFARRRAGDVVDGGEVAELLDQFSTSTAQPLGVTRLREALRISRMRYLRAKRQFGELRGPSPGGELRYDLPARDRGQKKVQSAPKGSTLTTPAEASRCGLRRAVGAAKLVALLAGAGAERGGVSQRIMRLDASAHASQRSASSR